MRLATCSLTVLAALGACSSQELTQTSGGVLMPASALDFGSAFIGYPLHRTLSVENTSPADITLAIATAAPFGAPPSLVLSGGQVLSVEITFDPSAVGPVSGSITLVGDRVHLVATLSGQGESAPNCGPPAACSSVTFDPDAGACVTTVVADGTDCSSSALCLDHPVCQGGTCQGAELSCDDHNVCTTDSCSPTVGCTHVAIACPSPSDPCQAAACDPSSGCGSQAAPDGTVCGSVDCTTAHICLLGSCQAVSVPDGSECAPATACRGEGTCQGGTCDIPDAGVMVPAWTYSLDGGGEIGFNGTLDADSDLYWTECVDTCQLVSATRDGYLRYRVPLAGSVIGGFGLATGGGTNFGLFEDTIAMVTVEGAVEAHAAATGALVWSSGPDDIFSDGGSPGAWQIAGLVGGPPGEIEVVAQQVAASGPGPFAPEVVVLLLALSDGHLISGTQYPASIGAPIGDANGTLWLDALFVQADGGGNEEGTLIALGTDGGIAGGSSIQGVEPVAAYDGWVFANGRDPELGIGPLDGGLVDGAQIVITGSSDLYELDYGYPIGTSPVFDGTIGFLFANSAYGACAGGPCGPTPIPAPTPLISGFDPDAGAVSWGLSVPSPSWYGYYDAILTNRSSVLVALASLPLLENTETPDLNPLPLQGTGPLLLEISSQGNLLSSCALPTVGDEYESTVAGAALQAGRWFVSRYPDGITATIEAYDIPGADIDPHGWVCAGGNPARTARPW